MAAPLEVLRLVVGSLFVLLAPGLAWSFVLFPLGRRMDAPREAPGIDWIERVAIAFGLSIALVPLSIFLLNYFLKVPVNTWSVALIVLVLTLAPIGYLYVQRRRRDGRAAPTAAPR